MEDFKSLSTTKVMFRYIQAAHHRDCLKSVPKGISQIHNKLKGSIRPALPNQAILRITGAISAQWTTSTVSALQDHYGRVMKMASSTLASRPTVAPQEFEETWKAASKWALKALGKKLAQHTLDTSKGVCREALCKRNSTQRPLTYAEAVGASTPNPPQVGVEPRPPPTVRPAELPVTQQPEEVGWTLVQGKKAAKPIRLAADCTIRAVSGEQDPLSNFYKFEHRVGSKKHNSVEQVYQLCKARHFDHRQAFETISKATNASKAKKASDNFFKSRDFKAIRQRVPWIKRADDVWSKVARRDTVHRLLREKLQQCPPFKQALLESQGMLIVHNVPDRYWGTGSTDANSALGKGGQNIFGVLLMELRGELVKPLKQPTAPVPSTSEVQEVPRLCPEVVLPPKKAENPGPVPNLTPLCRPRADRVEKRKERSPGISPDAKRQSAEENPQPTWSGPSPSHVELPVTPTSGVSISGPHVKELDRMAADQPSTSTGGMTITATRAEPLADLSDTEISDSEVSFVNEEMHSKLNKDSLITGSQPAPSTKKQPKLVQYRSPPTNGSKNLLVCFPQKMQRYSSDREKDANWRPPIMGANIKVLIIGDSLISSISRIQAEVATTTRIASYPGAKFRNLFNVLKDQPVNTGLKHVVLSIGVNNHTHDFAKTAEKHLRGLVNRAKEKFPNAKLYFPKFIQKFPEPAYNTNLRAIEKFCNETPGIQILEPHHEAKLAADNYHWTVDSANKMLDGWLDQFTLN